MICKKIALRKEILARRRALGAEIRELFSQRICENLLSSTFYQEAQNIFLYRAMPDEVDLSIFASVARKDGKQLFYPHCTSDTEMIPLNPCEDLWVKGRFGIWEPNPFFSQTISPSKLDLVICPCAAFDPKCNRLGMGAGYYDRFLEKCPQAHIIAVAFQIQQTKQLPVEPWDHSMEMVYTESNIFIQKEAAP